MNSFFINFGFILLYIEEETFTPAKNELRYKKKLKDIFSDNIYLEDWFNA